MDYDTDCISEDDEDMDGREPDHLNANDRDKDPGASIGETMDTRQSNLVSGYQEIKEKLRYLEDQYAQLSKACEGLQTQMAHNQTIGGKSKYRTRKTKKTDRMNEFQVSLVRN